ncbi:retrovirus-related pol polyprotein from transposon TNT 1-94, partial [Tanacetum coccineum]
STIDVVEDIPVDVPNIFPTHPTLHMDFNFIPSHNDLGSDLDVSSPSRDRNKIYDSRICIEVESTRFLATFPPMFDTLLPFSSRNEDKVFNHGVLASKEKSPPSSSHRGFKASKLFHHKSLMLIHGENNPNMGVHRNEYSLKDKNEAKTYKTKHENGKSVETNLSEDIQCAGSDSRPPMLDRTDFASWQQRIRLYCQGKENGVNILKSIDEGPFQMGTFRETLAEGNKDKERYNVDIRATNILLQGLPKDIYSLINHYTDAKDIWDNVNMLPGRTSSNPRNQATVQDGRVVVQNVQGRQNRGQGNNARGAGTAGYGGAQNRVGNANPGQARQVKCYNCNGICHIARNCTQPKRPQNSEYFKDKMLLMQAQENGVALDEEQLLFLAGGQDNAVDEDVDEQPVQDLALNVDNVFQADDCDAFDSDVDEAPTTQTMFMANLSSTDLMYDEAGPSYDSNILSEVHDHDHYQDAVCEHHEEHEMHDDVQPNYVVDSHADYTNDRNMIPYD